MKVSINWLQQYVDLQGKNADELEELFSLRLTEVEERYQLASAKGMRIGYVKECVNHPDSDHLHVCQIEVEPGVVNQIVCGAPNMRQGVKVLVAMPGTELPGGIKIKPSKIRGVESNGMCCSFQELGIEEKYVDEEFKDGIYLLDDDAPVGADPLEYLKLNDFVFDLSITPNRADLLSMIGVAYDVASALGEDVKLPENNLKEVNKKNPVKVAVETDKVIQYHARYINNVKIQKSPWWLRQRLIASGIRPINNVVDISNYILIEYGQPLHTFDGAKLGNNIVVRNAYEGEKFVTLDEQERILTANDIVITDGKEPVCLGGVMGGLNTEVDNNTTSIVLEAAQFDPTSIRKTSARLGLRSESSYRFERRIDYNRVKVALDKAAEMLADLAGGEVYEGVSSVINKEFKPVTIEISLDKINSYMGVSLKAEEVSQIIANMDFEFNYDLNTKMFTVNVPSRRIDYDDNYQDLIEDIARFYGYDNIPLTLPKTDSQGKLTKEQSLERNIKHLLAGLGMNEAISYSLTSEEHLYEFADSNIKPVKILMPITEERSYMRLCLIPSLLDVVAYNKARKMDSAKFFEISNVYGEGIEERKLAGVFSGIYEKSLWQAKSERVDFFLAKGILDELFNKLGLEATYEKAEIANLHPGKTALIKVGEEVLGYLGAIHPAYQKAHSLNETYVFELDFNKIIELASDKSNYKPVSKYPSIQRDLAIVCSKEISSADITSMIKQTARKLLVDLELFDLYTDESIGADNKQLAYKLTFCDTEKTLETADVDKVIKSILNRLEFTFKATLRQ